MVMDTDTIGRTAVYCGAFQSGGVWYGMITRVDPNTLEHVPVWAAQRPEQALDSAVNCAVHWAKENYPYSAILMRTVSLPS